MRIEANTMRSIFIAVIFLAACSSPAASNECPASFVDEDGRRQEYSCPPSMIRVLRIGNTPPDGGKPIRICVCQYQ